MSRNASAVYPALVSPLPPADYVDMILAKLKDVVPLVRANLHEEHFIMFCDKVRNRPVCLLWL